jgi:hypothetical protein
MKTKKYYTIGKISKSNIKFVEKDKCMTTQYPGAQVLGKGKQYLSIIKFSICLEGP